MNYFLLFSVRYEVVRISDRACCCTSHSIFVKGLLEGQYLAPLSEGERKLSGIIHLFKTGFIQIYFITYSFIIIKG